MEDKIAIIQPLIPSYRQEFFLRLSSKINYDLFTLSEKKSKHREGLSESNTNVKHLKTLQFKQFRWFNPFPILRRYKTIVLCGESSIITNWVILLLSKFVRNRILIWGHGVTYSKNKPINLLHKLMYFLCDGGIYYTQKEMRYWKIKFPHKNMTALNNTLYVNQDYLKLLNSNKVDSINALKNKYEITQRKLFISCYRFTNPNRRNDLLESVIAQSDKDNVGFIIIGDGYLKPDFSKYSNVYDFGFVWNDKLKTELFFIADFYLQFGAVGLSIVEAFAYGIPVITLRRSMKVKQGTEYFYLKNEYNSLLLNTIEDFNSIYKISDDILETMSRNALNTYDSTLQIDNMVDNFIRSISCV